MHQMPRFEEITWHSFLHERFNSVVAIWWRRMQSCWTSLKCFRLKPVLFVMNVRPLMELLSPRETVRLRCGTERKKEERNWHDLADTEKAIEASILYGMKERKKDLGNHSGLIPGLQRRLHRAAEHGKPLFYVTRSLICENLSRAKGKAKGLAECWMKYWICCPCQFPISYLMSDE